MSANSFGDEERFLLLAFNYSLNYEISYQAGMGWCGGGGGRPRCIRTERRKDEAIILESGEVIIHI